jgi:RNA polymerase sigma-70 factor (ECF subfamily)
MTETAEESVAPPTPEIVFREYAPRIYHLARRMLGNDADAEDVTSEVLMQVVRKLHTFRGEAQLPTWLHRVTVNAALAHREKRANRTKHEQGSAEDALEAAVSVDPSGRVRLARPAYGATPADIVLADEERELIEEAVQKLPEPFRDVYVLADVEGLPNTDIAEMLDLSLPAVKSRLHRARLRMRDLLAPHYADAEAMELTP